MYVFSKLLWLLDIVFFILKKKTMTPFRLYHHVALLMFVWWVCATRQGLMRWLIMINSFTTISFYAVPVFISNIPLATRMFMLYMIAVSFLEVRNSKVSRVAGTMVALSSSVRVIARSNPSQVPPLMMHVGKRLAVMHTIKRLAGIVPKVDIGNLHYICLCKTCQKQL